MENVALESKFTVIFFIFLSLMPETHVQILTNLRAQLNIYCMAERGNSFEAKVYVACHLE